MGRSVNCFHLQTIRQHFYDPERQRNQGRSWEPTFCIDPFTDEQLNPNSYNLRLHDELLVYEEIILDMRRPSRFRRLTIPEEGLVLQPNQLYLARTIEHTETHNLVPMLEGRSSIGRLGTVSFT